MAKPKTTSTKPRTSRAKTAKSKAKEPAKRSTGRTKSAKTEPAKRKAATARAAKTRAPKTMAKTATAKKKAGEAPAAKRPVAPKPASAKPVASKPAAAGQAPADRNAPLFYRKPVPLRAEAHRDLTFTPGVDFSFARNHACVPLNMSEMLRAQASYPIVFSSDDNPVPLAVTGMTVDRNVFIDADGHWAADHYVPVYVRRYPFILMARSGARHVLCIDETDARLATGDGRPLFDSHGAPTKLVENAITFCRSHHEEHHRTRVFCAALKAQGLLQRGRINVGANGSALEVSGFRVVDQKAFNALADETFLDWRRKGWVAAVYAHMLSLSNWPRIAERAHETAQAA